MSNLLPMRVFYNTIDAKGAISLQSVGGMADGATNNYNAFISGNASGYTLVLSSGTYYITSNVSVTVPVVFENGAKIQPSTGITVTLSGGYIAQPKQHIFDISAGGKCFSARPSNSTQYHWGAIGDGTTDDTRAVQSCIDQAIFWDKSKVCNLIDGTHKVDRIFLGYGLTGGYTSCLLRGVKSSYGYNEYASFGGTILKTDTWENAIECNSFRDSVIENISLIGPWYNNINNKSLGAAVTPSYDATDYNNWIPTGIPSGNLTRYAYSCGIHMDPRCGTAPTTGYSNMVLPSYAGHNQHYNFNASSRLTISHSVIRGFGIGVASQGCNHDGNGDFLNIDNSEISYCGIGVAWGNTQFRQFNATNTLFNRLYTVIDTDTIGARNGKPMAYLNGCNLDLNHRIFNVQNGAWGGFITLKNCYAEGLYTIGDVTNGAIQNGIVLNIDSCNFNFNNLGFYYLPKYIVNIKANRMNIVGSNLDFNSMAMPFVIKGVPENVNISATLSNMNWGGCDGYSKAIIASSTANVMFLNSSQGPWNGEGSYYPGFNAQTSGLISAVANTYGPLVTSDKTKIIPFCAKGVVSTSLPPQPNPIPVYLGYSSWNQGATSAGVSVSGRTLNLNIVQTVSTIGRGQNRALIKSNIIYHTNSETLYAINSVSGTGYNCTLLNGYHKTSGTPITPADNVGTYYFIGCGHFTTPSPYEMTWTSGSSTVSFAKPDGTAMSSGDIPTGCAIVNDDRTSALIPVTSPNCYVASIGAGTVTFGGNATETKKTGPLLWWINRF